MTRSRPKNKRDDSLRGSHIHAAYNRVLKHVAVVGRLSLFLSLSLSLSYEGREVGSKSFQMKADVGIDILTPIFAHHESEGLSQHDSSV